MNGFARYAGIFAGGENPVGVEDVDEMVGDTAALVERQLGSADVEMAVDALKAGPALTYDRQKTTWVPTTH